MLDDRAFLDLRNRILADEAGALEELSTLCYRELKELGRRAALSPAMKNPTMGPTALVNELFAGPRMLAIIQDSRTCGQFFAVAAKALRQVALDYWRKTTAEKRGGHRQRTQLDELMESACREIDPSIKMETEEDLDHAMALVGGAMESLKNHDESLFQVVSLKCFGGLSFGEIGQFTGMAKATAASRWKIAIGRLREYSRKGKGDLPG